MTPSEALAREVAAGRLQPDAGQARAAERLSRLCEEVARWKGGQSGLLRKARPTPRGVYLWGGVGTGKSLMMDLFFQSAPIPAKRRVHFHQFLQEIQKRVTAERARRDSDPLPRVGAAIARETRLLCFDELQVTDVGDAMILGRLFQALFESGVLMVATSNRPPADLYKNGLNRQLFLPFIALIESRMEVMRLDEGKDYRLDALETAPGYFTPLGPETDAAMDRCFARLTGGAHAAAGELQVGGRRLEVPLQAAGVARFPFEALCARPLGPADYHAVATGFETVMIDRVPVMTPDRRDQAKRFATLIDELYEAKTRLAVSAAAEPSGLYPEGDYAFEFERTASRLVEMRARMIA